MSRIVVTGSRDWSNAVLLRHVLNGFKPARIGVGDCPTGADPLALAWAEDNAYAWQRYEADWDTRGKAAGPFRNREMLELERPELVIAFKLGLVSKGTDDCIRAANERGIQVLLIQVGA